MIASVGHAQNLLLSLTPSNFNNFQVSCFGKRDGSIDLTVSGGVPPYNFYWSNGATTEDLSDLPAGYYHVKVTDRNGKKTEMDITLSEPEMITTDFVVSSYPNGYNISCNNCFNGSIYNFPSGGVAPYTYAWEDGPSTKDRIALGRGTYAVVITDANGCTYTPEQFHLFEPDRSDWTMNGNSGSNPGINFIGTSDNKDLVFKTNNLEQLRILANGNIKFSALAGNGNKQLVIDNNGVISLAPCKAWDQCGNTITGNDFIGSKNAIDIKFKVNANVNNNPVMTLKVNGDVGIGTDDPKSKLEIQHHTPNGSGGINLVNSSGGNYNSEIKFSSPFSLDHLWAIGNDVQHNGGQNFFIYDNTANYPYGRTRFLINADGDIGVGTESPNEKLQVEGGNIFINSENSGLIIDENNQKRVGFLKYSGREGGIWRAEGVKFEIGRAMGVTSLPGTPSSLQTDMIIDGAGKVGLGVVPPSGSMYRLFVEDGIATRDIMVQATGWPDFVFDDHYPLLSISELEQFIYTNKHLPNVPSECDILEKGGYDLGEMQTILLQKIEEQSLYIIDLQHQIDALKLMIKDK